MIRGMFDEELVIMDRRTQIIANQLIVTWVPGAEIYGELSISNMESTRLAEAQGVQATGTLMLELDRQGRDKFPVTINTYLYHPKSGQYIRVHDIGVVEAGVGVLNKRQYSVEAMTALPT